MTSIIINILVNFAIKIIRNKKTTIAAIAYLALRFMPSGEVLPDHITNALAEIVLFIAMLFSRDVDK